MTKCCADACCPFATVSNNVSALQLEWEGAPGQPHTIDIARLIGPGLSMNQLRFQSARMRVATGPKLTSVAISATGRVNMKVTQSVLRTAMCMCFVKRLMQQRIGTRISLGEFTTSNIVQTAHMLHEIDVHEIARQKQISYDPRNFAGLNIHTPLGTEVLVFKEGALVNTGAADLETANAALHWVIREIYPFARKLDSLSPEQETCIQHLREHFGLDAG